MHHFPNNLKNKNNSMWVRKNYLDKN